MHLDIVQHMVRQMANPAIAAHSQRFFKTGPGQYGEGDLFLGIRVPQLRRLIAPCIAMPWDDLLHLLCSPYHEERLLALLLMVARFQHSSPEEQDRIYSAYLAHTAFINNWDLVDCSAPPIVGAFLSARKDRDILRRLARSALLWERRIAIMATMYFIRKGDFTDCLAISLMLLSDRHDLIHKAVGWMLREIGKKDQTAAEMFLRRHHRHMPRTMLRYAIEHLPPAKRKAFLLGVIDDYIEP
jgi:3-methyladenine DNA glycosylase AlkD